MIRIAIADDDAGMRAVLQKIIKRAEGYVFAGAASDGPELLKLNEEEKPDVIILDVEMPGLSGIECARVLQDQNPRTILVFATAHEKYMSEAFEVYAFDYLLKPFKVERALKTLALIKDRLTVPEKETAPALPARRAIERLMVRHKEGVAFLDMNELLLIQREERATVLYATGGARFVTGESLNELQARLPEDIFFRCHKSYIVNINHIDAISPYGRWTYIVRLRGTDRDALITHERFEELQKSFA